MMGARLCGLVEELDEYSVFSCFWAKLSVIGRISGAGVIGDGAGESDTVKNGVGEEKPMLSDDLSLIRGLEFRFSRFFPFMDGAGDCEVAVWVG
jgi:hypothetical protein